jgi:hypothetical protein
LQSGPAACALSSIRTLAGNIVGDNAIKPGPAGLASHSGEAGKYLPAANFPCLYESGVANPVPAALVVLRLQYRIGLECDR